jgi:hypothetical protein
MPPLLQAQAPGYFPAISFHHFRRRNPQKFRHALDLPIADPNKPRRPAATVPALAAREAQAVREPRLGRRFQDVQLHITGIITDRHPLSRQQIPHRRDDGRLRRHARRQPRRKAQPRARGFFPRSPHAHLILHRRDDQVGLEARNAMAGRSTHQRFALPVRQDRPHESRRHQIRKIPPRRASLPQHRRARPIMRHSLNLNRLDLH